jgi:hypothetical protein
LGEPVTRTRQLVERQLRQERPAARRRRILSGPDRAKLLALAKDPAQMEFAIAQLERGRPLAVTEVIETLAAIVAHHTEMASLREAQRWEHEKVSVRDAADAVLARLARYRRRRLVAAFSATPEALGSDSVLAHIQAVRDALADPRIGSLARKRRLTTFARGAAGAPSSAPGFGPGRRRCGPGAVARPPRRCSSWPLA